MIQAQAVLGQILEPFAHAEAILLDGFKSRVRTDVVDSATFIPATSTNFGLAVCERINYPNPAPRKLHVEMR